MRTKIIFKIKVFVATVKQVMTQFKNQYSFELKNISTCSVTMKHLINVKITGKAQCVDCLAEEIASDDGFLFGFSPSDIRTITYLVASDKYEAMLREEKINKSYEIIRANSVDNRKFILIRNKITGETFTKSIQDFSGQKLIENLDSRDAYHIGYLAGQEKTFQDLIRLKTMNSKINHELIAE